MEAKNKVDKTAKGAGETALPVHEKQQQLKQHEKKEQDGKKAKGGGNPSPPGKPKYGEKKKEEVPECTHCKRRHRGTCFYQRAVEQVRQEMAEKSGGTGGAGAKQPTGKREIGFVAIDQDGDVTPEYGLIAACSNDEVLDSRPCPLASGRTALVTLDGLLDLLHRLPEANARRPLPTLCVETGHPLMTNREAHWFAFCDYLEMLVRECFLVSLSNGLDDQFPGWNGLKPLPSITTDLNEQMKFKAYRTAISICKDLLTCRLRELDLCGVVDLYSQLVHRLCECRYALASVVGATPSSASSQDDLVISNPFDLEEAFFTIDHGESALSAVSSDDFVVDSGATKTMVQSTDGFIAWEPDARPVHVVGKRSLRAKGIGTLRVSVVNQHGKTCILRLSNVLIVPDLGFNLLSIKSLCDKGASASFTQDGGQLGVGDHTFPFTAVGSLYTMPMRPVAEGAFAVVSTGELWHGRCGHRHAADIKQLGAIGLLPPRLKMPDNCDACQVGKHKKLSCRGKLDRGVTSPLERVYVDLLGPVKADCFDGAKYALGIVDAYSRMRFVYFLEKKSDTLAKFKEFIMVVNGLLHGVKLKEVWTDGGTEFYSDAFEQLLRSNGIRHTGSGPYCPQQNGIVERSWHTLVSQARCLRIQAGFGLDLWAECLNTAVYLTNRVSIVMVDDEPVTPYYAFFGKHASLSHLRLFGCRAYVHYNDNEKQPKFGDRAWRGIFVGYHHTNPSCYRIYDPVEQIIHQSVHVTFNEAHIPFAGSVGDAAAEVGDVFDYDDAEDDADGDPFTPLPYPEPVGVDRGPASNVSGPPRRTHRVDFDPDDSDDPPIAPDVDSSSYVREPVGRSRRVRPPPSLADYVCLASDGVSTDAVLEYALTADGDEPASYAQALRSPQALGWQKAMDDEVQSHVDNGTWQLVHPRDLPPNASVIGSRWVYKIKRDERGQVSRLKARLVAQGYCQEQGRDYQETFAPVARMTTFRVLMALAAYLDLELHGMDVHTAFLNSDVEELVYMKQPKGFEYYDDDGVTSLVCKLDKSIYGLKQSPRNWNKLADDWFKSYGFTPSQADPCLYIKRDGSVLLIVVLYVDDLIIASNSVEVMDKFKKDISQRFKMTDTGPVKWILGVEVIRDREKRTIELKQTAYIDKLIKSFGMEDCRSISTPMDANTTRAKDGEGTADRHYMSLVGGLLYAAILTRPDISFAVQDLAKNMQASTEEHWTIGKRVLRYLKSTCEIGITYGPSSLAADPMVLVGYSDSDWGGDKATGRSTSAYVFMLGGACVSWASVLQKTVALSSAEAELMASTEAAKEAIYLRLLLSDLGFPQEEATVIYEDNQACIKMSENPVHHKKSKHINMRYYFVRDKVEEGEIKLIYIPTAEQLADLLTKPLLRLRLTYLRDIVMNLSHV